MEEPVSHSFLIPGTGDSLLYEHDAGGQLLSLRCNGRVYFERRDGRGIYDGGLAFVREMTLPRGLLRRVQAGSSSWLEKYLADDKGHMIEVDGVTVQHDEQNRVTACLGPAGEWRYTHGATGLAGIRGPGVARRLERGEGGRPARVHEPTRLRDIRYDEAGRRLDVQPAPAGWHRDLLGRLWTVVGPDGRVVTTYLWDGFRCLGRIDGPPGAPLAAVFSLDLSYTPVRVITHDGVTAIPRDAFGEALLAHPGVPGLFGGAVHRGKVYYHSRVLDPRLGAFDRPDPWSGGEEDPRRDSGYRGPLWAEAIDTPYAVCQGDPVSRTDPTGEVSASTFLTPLSSLTWATQNSVLTWIGFDLTINLWGSLLTFGAGGYTGRFFQDWIYGDVRTGKRQQTFAFRRDGFAKLLLPPGQQNRALTFQHIIWSRRSDLDALDVVRVVDPGAEFLPRLYGSLLLVTPQQGGPIVLIGDGNVAGSAGFQDWTRAGGAGQPILPCSDAVRFPRGGLHLDATQPNHRSGQSGSLAELVPSGGLASGLVQQRARISIPRTALGLAAGSLVLLTDVSNRAAILEAEAVEEVAGETHIWLASDPQDIDRTGLRLRSLQIPPASTEDIPRVGGQDATLNLSGVAPVPAPPNYAAGDPVRFLDPAGGPIGAGLVQRFEASLTLDAALPDGLPAPLTVRHPVASAGGKANLTGDPLTLEFGANPAPGKGQAILLARGPLSIAVVVRDESGTQRIVEREVNAALGGSPGDEVDWQNLNAPGDIGRRETALDAAALATLVYTPVDERTAPPQAGHVLVEDASPLLHARTVAAVNYDALVFHQPLPAGPDPVRAERYVPVPPGAAGHLDEIGVRLDNFLTMTLDPPVLLEGEAMQLLELGAPALATVPVAATPAAQITSLAGAVATLSAVPAGTQPFPSQLVVLEQGGTREAALVRRARLTLNLDRQPNPSIDGVADLELVRLAEAGPAYAARGIDATHVIALPEVVPPPVGGVSPPHIPAQMPRFRAGNLVLAEGAGLANNQLYRVAAVERNGTALTLVDGPGLPVPAPPDLTITLLGPADPGNGTARDGIRGTAQTPAGGNTQLTCDVWTLRTPAANQAIGIVAGQDTHPARIVSVSDPLLELGAVPGLVPAAGAPLNVRLPTLVSTALSTTFRREGNSVLIFDDNPPGLTPGTANLVAVVPFQETLRVDGATLSSGTALVPQDPENVELDRLQSLIDHELRHTEQGAMWGPLLLTWTPLLAFQVPLELGGEFEMPEFSAYVGAVVEREEAGTFLRIPDTQGIAFAAGDIAQVSQTLAGRPLTVTLGEKRDEHRFVLSSATQLTGQALLVRKQGDPRDVSALIRREGNDSVLHIPDLQGIAFDTGDQVELRQAGPAEAITLGAEREEEEEGVRVFAILDADAPALPTGNVQIRRVKSQTPFWSTLFRILQLFTAGGVMSLIAGTIWGGILLGVGKLGYRLGRWAFTSDPSHPATVSQDRLSLEVSGDSLPDNLRDVVRVNVRSGESVVVRSVASIVDRRITLTSTLEFSGEVRVAPYAQRNAESAWDWHSYYPASVPDAARPTAIRVEQADGDTLSLSPFDRVLVKAGTRSVTTRVTAVPGNGMVELEESPPTSGDERTLRIARLQAGDPLQPYDGALLRAMGEIGWMRWFFDPWGQLHYATQPERGSFWDWVARIARYAFSTRSWGLAPLPGWFFWDNLAHQKGNNGHLSQMEQDASEESGDLYSPMSRLRPGEDALGLVGDVARFWYFPWGARGTVTVLQTGRRDSPGRPYNDIDRPRILPSFAPGGTSGTINDDNQAPAGSGAQLPDLFVEKDSATFDDPTVADPDSFVPSDVAYVPTSPQLERAIGAYVSFSRPGTHRISVDNDINMGAQARDIHDGGRSFLFKIRQPIFFDVTVDDVAVDIAGRRVAENDTVTLVQTQRAQVVVLPQDARRYAVTLLQPQSGALLQAEGDDFVVAQPGTGTEPAEISRLYTFTPDPGAQACETAGSFDEGRLNEHGVHVAHDIHVPVRRLQVRVVDTVAVRGAIPDAATLQADLALDAGAIAELRPGEEGFVLVPAPNVLDLRLATLTYAVASTPAPTDPVLDIDIADVPDAPAGWLSEGAAHKIALDAQDSPEERATATFAVDVGRTGNSAVLHATVDLVPHFRLILPGGASTDYRVSRSAGAPLVLECTDGVTAGSVVVTPSAGVTPSASGANVTLTIDAGAATGLRRVLVEDAGNAEHRARRTIEIVP